MRLRALPLVLLATLGAPLLPALARPDPTPSELSQAREQFAQARKLEDAGEWSSALELLQRVAAVKMTPQVRFHIALCLEHVGLLTEALDGFTQASLEAGTTAPDVVKESKQHVDALERRIPTLTLRVAGAEPSDRLYLDRRSIPLEDPPLPIRVDPGAHTAEVRRGEVVVARQVFATEPETTQRIEMRVSASAAPDASATQAAPAPTAPPPGGDRPANVDDGGNTQRTLGWVALGLGAASAITAGIFVGLRAGTLADVEESCPDVSKCNPAMRATVDPLVDKGKTYATLVNVFAAVAGAAGAGGAVLLLTAPSNARAGSSPPSIHARAILVPGAAHVSVDGRF